LPRSGGRGRRCRSCSPSGRSARPFHSERLDTIAAEHAGALGDAETLEAYLRHFTYRLGPEELEGMRRFRDLLAEHDIQEYQDARA
jgi:predicted solute-binding protein